MIVSLILGKTKVYRTNWSSSITIPPYVGKMGSKNRTRASLFPMEVSTYTIIQFLLKFTTSDVCIMFSLIFLNGAWQSQACLKHIHLRIVIFCVCLKCLFIFFMLKNQLLPSTSFVLRMPMCCVCYNKQGNGQKVFRQYLQKVHISKNLVTAWIRVTVLFNLVQMWKRKLLVRLSILLTLSRSRSFYNNWNRHILCD